MPAFPFRTRPATRADIPALSSLVEASIRGLGARDYNPQQVESSLSYLFGIDTQIIEDGTYYAVENEGELVACGGWSRRKTPFGGDQAADVQDAAFRDPATEPAVIRAFFVHPDWARRGIGRHLLQVCEDAARGAGFQRFELVATRTGRPLYAATGYQDREPVEIRLPDGVVIQAMRMEKA